MLIQTLKKTNFSELMILLVYVLAATVGMVKGGAWASISIAGGILTVLAVWRENKRFPMPSKEVAYFVGAFLILAEVMALLSPFQDQALYSSFKLMTIFVPLAFFASPALGEVGRKVLANYKKPWVVMLSCGVLLLVVVLIVTIREFRFESAAMTKLNRGLSHGLLLVLPFLAVAFINKSKFGFALLGAMIWALLLTHSRTTQAAAVAGGVMFGFASFWPVLATRLMGAGMVLSLGWPFCAAYVFDSFREIVMKLPDTLVARIEIWDYLAYRIAERPFFGWGLGGSQKLEWAQPNGDLYTYTTSVAAHPHNAIMQLWVEMGIPGLVFGGLACFWLFKVIKKLQAAYVPYALAAFAVAYVLLMAAYNLWTDSLWGAFALTIFAFASFGRGEIKTSLNP